LQHTERSSSTQTQQALSLRVWNESSQGTLWSNELESGEEIGFGRTCNVF